ncbi:MAG: metallophosphoesterase family protein [Bacteroidota bacterium]
MRALFITIFLSTFLLRFGCTQIGNLDYYPPTPIPDRIILTLTESPSTSMAVNWRTSLAVNKALVQVAKADASPEFKNKSQLFEGETTALLTDRNGANYHSAVMTELEPETLYAYRVGNGVHWSEWIHFRTASSEPEPLSFLYFGDAQNDLKSMWSRVVRGAYSKMPEANFMIHAGDLINRANSDHEWGEWFYAGGWVHSSMPSIATPGNHEYYRNAERQSLLSKHWQPTFTLPENGPEGSEETVYYVDYQDTRIISLNSISLQISPQDSAAQVNWLKEVLKKNDQKWTVVTTHYPIYSSKRGRDNIGLRDALQPLFEKYKVDLVLQGHDHTYGRGTNLPLGNQKTTIGGPIYVVSVSGPKMYDIGLEDWMQRAASNTQLYQLIKIEDNKLRYEAYTVTGELYDAFELEKQKNGRNLFVDLAPKEVEERLEIPERMKREFTEEDIIRYEGRLKAYKERKMENKNK